MFSNITVPEGGFKVIAADPPWHFNIRSDKGGDRSATAHYQTMTIEDILAMPVERLAAKDSVLLLWGINTMLPEALAVIECWGFTYKTVGFTWAKSNRKSPGYFMGLGYWTRQNTEFCLLATRGRPKRVSAGVRQLIVEPRREHSRKPDAFYAETQRLLDGPYLELFGRQSRPGWTVWGNQADKFNMQPEAIAA
jgi:N6-adenosine-specific RNA methylase IME4